jgi:diaminopimelate epimerase
MPRIPFHKVEGLGNDFLVIDLRPGQPGATHAELVQAPETVRALCDRNFGVGGDGVLAILPGSSGDVRMRVLNADGSEAEMCGNGIRCVAKVIYDEDPSLHRSPLRIDTGAGRLECEIHAPKGVAETVTVEMGAPRLTPSEVPVDSPLAVVLRQPFRAQDREFLVTAVSMGNPHAVIFLDDPTASLLELARAFGPTLEHDVRFPRRINVEFARVRTSSSGAPEIDLVVWERGCGITLACGTGACATVVAGCLEGRVAANLELPVHLPGGTLFIRVTKTGEGQASFTGVQMRGPANSVFAASVDPTAIHRPKGR